MMPDTWLPTVTFTTGVQRACRRHQLRQFAALHGRRLIRGRIALAMLEMPDDRRNDCGGDQKMTAHFHPPTFFFAAIFFRELFPLRRVAPHKLRVFSGCPRTFSLSRPCLTLTSPVLEKLIQHLVIEQLLDDEQVRQAVDRLADETVLAHLKADF